MGDGSNKYDVVDRNLKVNFVKGENSNKKITYKSDIEKINIKFGIGFDVHRLVPNKKLYLDSDTFKAITISCNGSMIRKSNENISPSLILNISSS